MGTKGNKAKQKPRNSSSKSQQKQYVVLKKNEKEKELLDDLSYSSGKKRQAKPSKLEEDVEYTSDSHWSPSPYSAFKLLISARFAAALWTTISDCDETFNYWEPVHYLLYGKGFQTWEYSPEYALRSYTYLLLHAVPAKIYDYFLNPTPLLIFFFVRCFLAFISAGTEVYLYRSVRRKLGGNVSRIALVTSLFSAGMYISSCAFLPSSFSAYMTSLAIGAWLDGSPELAIFSVALSALLSWPFAALTGVMIAIDIVFIQRKIILFIKWSFISLLVILVPVVTIDSHYYGKTVIAPWNIVKYNIFSTKGPDLYGTEPWTFYLLNGTLNFNLMFAAALFSPIAMLLAWRLNENVKEKFVIIGTIYLWLGVFVVQPHKEERFLYPIYPLISVAGAIGIDCVQKFVDFLCSKMFLYWIQRVKDLSKLQFFDYRRIVTAIGVASVISASLVGCSRILALHYGYRAPFDIFFQLHRDATAQDAVLAGRNLTVCYGKEWHRFPTSFFIPTVDWDVRFIKSEFKGQLPNLYSPFDDDGTRKIPEHMNDDNAEETSRYIDIKRCDYLVDLVDSNRITPNEPNYADRKKEWKVLSEYPFLDNIKSHRYFRAFYIPWLSDAYTHYNQYVLLERRVKPPLKRTGKEFLDDDLL